MPKILGRIHESEKEGGKVSEEVKRLREALRFYASQDNYYTMSMMLRKRPEDECPPILNDRGGIARAALGGKEAK